MICDVFSEIVFGVNKYTKEEVLDVIHHWISLSDKPKLNLPWLLALANLYGAFACVYLDNTRIYDAILLYCATSNGDLVGNNEYVGINDRGKLYYCPWLEEALKFDWERYFRRSSECTLWQYRR